MTPGGGRPDSSMPEWLGQRALLSPERLALTFGTERWTFAELDRRVQATARALSGLDINPGNRIAVLMRNTPRFVELAHALPRTGAILVPLNTRLTTRELHWQLQDVGAAALLYDQRHREVARELTDTVPGLRTASDIEAVPQADPDGPDAIPQPIDISALHTIIYTSGTSGQPKGTMLSHGNHFWSAVGSALNLGLHENDRWLACLPLFHIGGLAILLRSVIYGIPVVLQDEFDPVAANRAIDNEGITVVSVVANMLQRIVDARGNRPMPPTLRCLLLGGGPAPRPLLEECASRKLPVVQTYGLTEAASQVTTLTPEDALPRLGSAGRPLFPTEVRIVAYGDTPLPSGEAGQIVVRGPTVTPGYFNRPQETERLLENGWLHTGDIGYLDQEGCLHVLDRRDDLIVSGGENVYPAEVEEVLRSHPDVLDAGTTGLQNERWGQIVVATVSLREGATLEAEDLLQFCRDKIAPYKVPRRVRFAPTLPRNTTGKLLRQSLREDWRRELTS